MAKFTYQDRPEVSYIREEGIFELCVVEGKEEIKKGDDTLTLTFESKNGGRISDTFYFTEKGYWFVEKFMRKIGIVVKKGDDVEVDKNTFVGGRVKARVAARSYTKPGETEARTAYEIKEYFAIGEATASSAAGKPVSVSTKPSAPLRVAAKDNDLPY